LAKAVAKMPADLATPKTIIRVGHPATEISKEANLGNYNLVVLGERSQHGLRTRWLGATAQQVITQVQKPVLIAKEQGRVPAEILLCEGGAGVITVLDRFADHLPDLLAQAEKVTVLHVMSQIAAGPSVVGEVLQANAAEIIAEEAPEGSLLAYDLEVLENSMVTARPKVRHGFVLDEILAEASEGLYDMVVIGAHRSEGWQRFLLDDIAQQILLNIDRPLLVIPNG
jgi:nucleotide-binding universal stress UspA family protein